MARKKKKPHVLLGRAVRFMIEMPRREHNLFMPGDARYQASELQALLGYDRWACWLIIVEWFWLKTLALLGEMPASTARLLTNERLFMLLKCITTTKQDAREYGRDGKKGTNHDINALIELMKRHLPRELHGWIHFGATSYDIINTAYALQIQMVYKMVFWPKLCEVDKLWRRRIAENAEVLMMGRTHLQHALPITAGFWLANLHSRYTDTSRKALELSQLVPGKFTGAVGTSASQRALIKSRRGQKVIMGMLGLPIAPVTNQITPPEAAARYYSELVLLSGSMANLGDDIRKLVAPEYGEVLLSGSATSTSSTMSHKKSNPIGPEQTAGMHVSVIAEDMKVTLTLISDFQRDLRWSNVMRSQLAVMTYCYQQVRGLVRTLKNFKIDEEACIRNFNTTGPLVMSELFHLSLQKYGLSNASKFANSVIVPGARENGCDLVSEMDFFCANHPKKKSVRHAWEAVPSKTKHLLGHPEEYIGDSVGIARKETRNNLANAA